MNKKNILLVLGFIVAIPAIILVLNVCTYALTGSGFLISGNGEINSARAVLAWLSSGLSVCLFGAAMRA
jgi:hypothetical protein